MLVAQMSSETGKSRLIATPHVQMLTKRHREKCRGKRKIQREWHEIVGKTVNLMLYIPWISSVILFDWSGIEEDKVIQRQNRESWTSHSSSCVTVTPPWSCSFSKSNHVDLVPNRTSPKWKNDFYCEGLRSRKCREGLCLSVTVFQTKAWITYLNSVNTFLTQLWASRYDVGIHTVPRFDILLWPLLVMLELNCQSGLGMKVAKAPLQVCLFFCNNVTWSVKHGSLVTPALIWWFS